MIMTLFGTQLMMSSDADNGTSNRLQSQCLSAGLGYRNYENLFLFFATFFIISPNSTSKIRCSCFCIHQFINQQGEISSSVEVESKKANDQIVIVKHLKVRKKLPYLFKVAAMYHIPWDHHFFLYSIFPHCTAMPQQSRIKEMRLSTKHWPVA